jgi:hypothetical protein
MNLELGMARLIELGAPARNALWVRLGEPTPDLDDPREAPRRGALVLQSIVALGAVNDPRIRSLPPQILPFLHEKTQRYVDELRTREPAQRDMRHERPVLFFERICWFQRYGAKAP